jgi:hypothetical protein
MSELSFKFGTPEPVAFKEYCSDTEFQARLFGTALVTYYDSLVYGNDDSARTKIQKKIYELIPECLARWPEGKLIMGPNNKVILSGLLEDALSEAGVTADVAVMNIDLVAGQKDIYQEQCGETLQEIICPQAKTDGLTDKPHGPLIRFSYDRTSHGMMAGSSSSSGEVLSWNSDGSIELVSSSSFSGNYSRTEYKVTPEAAQKVRDYVAGSHLAALAEKDIPTPVMYDCFTSSSICMTFDDSSVGGLSHNMICLQCGPAGMTFAGIEKQVSDLLKECVTTGEKISNENRQTGPMFGGFMSMDPVPEQSSVYWKCPHCGYDKNTGRFCCECGRPTG